jgi:shikimate dehydrogenase
VSRTDGHTINATTRCCAVFGHPIHHSASPAMHNAAFAALGLNWRYLAFDVEPGRLREAVEGLKAMRFAGVNLTVPHKILAVEMMDALDESARAWGAVNTLLFEARDAGGRWRPLRDFEQCPEGPVRVHGFNTDADAIVRAIREDTGVEPRGARVLLLGAGGAGRAAALRLAAEGVKILWLVNRTTEKAAALRREINTRFPDIDTRTGYPDDRVDLVLNATSLGLKPGDPLPFDGGTFRIRQTDAVYDMVYRPAETPLLKAARAAGIRASNGLGMLLYQGAKAFEIWTGQTAPVAVMRQALEENIYGS